MKTKIINCKRNDIVCHYNGQSYAQSRYLELDIRAENVCALYNPEIGNAVPMSVWHGFCRRYKIPAMTVKKTNQLMQDLRPLFDLVRSGSDIDWDGSNMVCRLSGSAMAAEQEIESTIANMEIALA